MDINDTSEDWDAANIFPGAANRENPFTVPQDYFENSADRIRSLIKLEQFQTANAPNGMTVPEAYFETLTERLETSVLADSWKATASEHSFATPVGYFEQSESRIMAAIAAEQSPVVKAPVRSLVPRFMRYTAAACVLVVAGLFIFNKMGSTNAEPKLSGVSDDEIVSYLQASSDAGDAPMIIDNLVQSNVNLPSDKGLKDEDIERYLGATSL